ncbi:DNA cytosine methyltransferase [Mycoplasma sp. 888]|nr:DNA cytosine methyltransferase [Mycoplasma sp. 888]WRQ26100.1 DNA cytosine methyltransferase [Mycoplasma sp. 888]
MQSFPDEWTFKGSIANQCKQIGNAVQVNLAKSVGKKMIKVLKNMKRYD